MSITKYNSEQTEEKKVKQFELTKAIRNDVN